MIEIFHDLLNGDKINKKLEEIFVYKGRETAEKIYNKIIKLLDYPNDDFVEKKKKVKTLRERLNRKEKEKEEEEKEEEEEEEKDEKNNEKINKKNDAKEKEKMPHDKK